MLMIDYIFSKYYILFKHVYHTSTIYTCVLLCVFSSRHYCIYVVLNVYFSNFESQSLYTLLTYICAILMVGVYCVAGIFFSNYPYVVVVRYVDQFSAPTSSSSSCLGVNLFVYFCFTITPSVMQLSLALRLLSIYHSDVCFDLSSFV